MLFFIYIMMMFASHLSILDDKTILTSENRPHSDLSIRFLVVGDSMANLRDFKSGHELTQPGAEANCGSWGPWDASIVWNISINKIRIFSWEFMGVHGDTIGSISIPPVMGNPPSRQSWQRGQPRLVARDKKTARLSMPQQECFTQLPGCWSSPHRKSRNDIGWYTGLVVEPTPLKKYEFRQLGWWTFPIYGKMEKCFQNHQPVYIYRYRYRYKRLETVEHQWKLGTTNYQATIDRILSLHIAGLGFEGHNWQNITKQLFRLSLQDIAGVCHPQLNKY